jgi:hypothetical protein
MVSKPEVIRATPAQIGTDKSAGFADLSQHDPRLMPTDRCAVPDLRIMREVICITSALYLLDRRFRGVISLGGHLKTGHMWSLQNRP